MRNMLGNRNTRNRPSWPIIGAAFKIYWERQNVVQDAHNGMLAHWAIREVAQEDLVSAARQLRNLRKRQQKAYRELATVGALNRDMAVVVTGLAGGHLMYPPGCTTRECEHAGCPTAAGAGLGNTEQQNNGQLHQSDN